MTPRERDIMEANYLLDYEIEKRLIFLTAQDPTASADKKNDAHNEIKALKELKNIFKIYLDAELCAGIFETKSLNEAREKLKRMCEDKSEYSPEFNKQFDLIQRHISDIYEKKIYYLEGAKEKQQRAEREQREQGRIERDEREEKERKEKKTKPEEQNTAMNAKENETRDKKKKNFTLHKTITIDEGFLYEENRKVRAEKEEGAERALQREQKRERERERERVQREESKVIKEREKPCAEMLKEVQSAIKAEKRKLEKVKNGEKVEDVACIEKRLQGLLQAELYIKFYQINKSGTYNADQLSKDLNALIKNEKYSLSEKQKDWKEKITGRFQPDSAQVVKHILSIANNEQEKKFEHGLKKARQPRL